MLAEVVGHGLVLPGERLRETMDEHRYPRKITGLLGGRDDHRRGAIAFQTVVEEAEGLRDLAGRKVVVHRHRLGVHYGAGVAIGVTTHGHGHGTELLSSGAELMLVPPSEHGDLVDRAKQAERSTPLMVAVHPIANARPGSGRCRAPLA